MYLEAAAASFIVIVFRWIHGSRIHMQELPDVPIRQTHKNFGAHFFSLERHATTGYLCNVVRLLLRQGARRDCFFRVT